MVDEQPHVELRPGQLSGRQRLGCPPPSAARATARASMRSDLPRSRLERLRAGHEPRRHPQLPARRARSETARRTRTRAGSPQAPTHDQGRDRAPTAARASNPRAPTAAVLSPSISPVAAATAASVCELLCMSAPSTIMSGVPFSLRLKWTAGGHGLLGARPRSYQVTPDIPDRRRATQQKGSQAQTGRQPQRESARRPVGTIPQRRTSPRSRITTASLNPSASGTRRRRQWAGRRDACTPSFAAAVWEIVQISRLRPDRESEVCLPSFLPSTTARLRGVGLR